jgi:hypothetical protein
MAPGLLVYHASPRLLLTMTYLVRTNPLLSTTARLGVEGVRTLVCALLRRP